MFWGHILKEGKSLSISSIMEQTEFPLLHISNVALPHASKAAKVSLLASKDKEFTSLNLATLQKDKSDVFHLDLYVSMQD